MTAESPKPQLPIMADLVEFFRPDLSERGIIIGAQALLILSGNIFYESLSPRELGYCYEYSDPKPHLAGRCAGKIAVARASHLPLNFENLSGIEILPAQILFNNPRFATSQAPHVVTTLDSIAGFRWAISLTHEVDTGIAAAVAVGISSANASHMYVGIDSMPRTRLLNALEDHGQENLRKIFSNKEIEEAKRSDDALTACWAGKEAVAKALQTGISPKHGVIWTDIEVIRTPEGQQSITLSGGAQKRAEKLGISEIKIITIGTSVKTAVVFAS